MIKYRARLHRRHNRPGLETLESRQLLATFSVTSLGDAGAGTLRDAIAQANAASGADTITFAIPGSGVHTIVPTTPLPNVTDPVVIDATTQPGYAGSPLIELNGSNILDGAQPPAPIPNVNGFNLTAGASTVRGFTINRFTGQGIDATGDGNTIAANYIGTNAAGTISLRNQSGGILLASRNNVVGGASTADRNVISGNTGSGISIVGNGTLQAAGNQILGNFIGTDFTGAADLGNTGFGINVSSAGNLIGGASPNIIAFNGDTGVRVSVTPVDAPYIGNTISRNSIDSNGGQGITFGEITPGNGGVPSLTSAAIVPGGVQVQGTLNSGSPNATYTVEFFSNLVADPSGFGEGQTFRGNATVTTNAQGQASISTILPITLPVGQFITATATDVSGTTRAFSQAVSIASTEKADLSISGFFFTNNGFFNPQTGQPLTYVLTVTNNGPSRSVDTKVVDTLPLGAVFISATSSQGLVPTSAPNGVATYSLGMLNSGQSVSLTLVVQPTISGPSTNIATVTDPIDPNPLNNQSAIFATVVPTPPADLAIVGASSPDPAAVGGQLTYLFVVQNTSFQTSATGVVITDVLPAGLTFVSARSSQGTVTQSNGTVVANIGTLLPAANATLTVIVRPTAAGLISNPASVRGNELDPNSLNNDVVVNTVVNAAPPADLAVAITAAPQPAQVGGNFTYVVLVSNKGPAPATNVVLTDLLPDAATIVSFKPSQGSATIAGNLITASLGNLPVGAAAVLTVVLRPGVAGTLESRADVTADQPDFAIADNTSTVVVTAVGNANPPIIAGQKLIVARKTIAAIVLSFSQSLDPTLAANPANYKIRDLGRNPNLPAKDGKEIAIASAVYDPATRSVRLTPRKPLAVGTYYKLVANGPGAPGITDQAGNVLDGDRNGLPDGIYESLIGRGTHDRPKSLQRGVSQPKGPVAHHAKPKATHKAPKSTNINIVVNN